MMRGVSCSKPFVVLGLAALAWLAWTSDWAADPAVEIVSPRNRSTALGASTIEVRVSVPAARRIERVEIVVDGRLIATLIAPPWRTAWDAGDGATGHRIEARLVLDGGEVVH